MNSQSEYRNFGCKWCDSSLPLDMYLGRNWPLLIHCRVLHNPIQLLWGASSIGSKYFCEHGATAIACYWAKTRTDQTAPKKRQSMPIWLAWQEVSQCHCMAIFPYSSRIFGRRWTFDARKSYCDPSHTLQGTAGQDSWGTPGYHKVQGESKAVRLVAWPLQRASLNLYQVLQGSKADSTAYDPITTVQVALAGGSNRPLWVEPGNISANCPYYSWFIEIARLNRLTAD